MPGKATAFVVSLLLCSSVTACGSDGGSDSGSTASEASEQGTITIAGGKTTIPQQNVGDVDLTKLPLGDDHVGQTPGIGELDLCNLSNPNAAAAPAGQTENPDWVHGNTFNLEQKLVVAGDVKWPEAEFSNQVQGDTRVLKGNDLPVGYDTGTFPVAADDPAYAFKPDPSSIVASDYEFELPANPSPAAEPGCVGGEVGVLLSGVVLFSPVDADNHDAIAQEVEDGCQGHPNEFGYHHHWVSTCVDDSGTGQSPVVGFAFDGYPITGHRGEDGQVLTNADLDECHGTTSPIELDGKTVTMYHYAAAWEFPYAVGCFHGTSAIEGPALGGADAAGGGGAAPTGAPPTGAPPP